MLLPEEQCWVARDPGIPGLRFAMDPQRFGAGLAACFPQLKVRGVQRRYLRYKPGVNCLAGYLLDTGSTPLSCHVKVFRRDAADKLSKGRELSADGNEGARWCSVVETECAEISVFPWDRRVPALMHLADPERRRRLVGRAVKRTQPELQDAAFRLLAYKPERRFVAALELAGEPRAVVKAYSSSSFGTSAQAIELQQHLASRDTVRLARLLGSSTKRGVRVFEWLPGRLLTEAMTDVSWEPSGCVVVGTALAVFQRHGFETLRSVPHMAPREITLVQEMEALDALVENLGFILPDIRSTVHRIRDALKARVPLHWAGGRVIHGDFYSKQVLLNGSEIGLIDLDELSVGDPRMDAGTFLAHLERERLCGRIEPLRAEALEAAFVAGYLDQVVPGAGRGVELFTALKLVARTQQFFRSCDPEWPRRIVEALERVQALLGLGSGNTVPNTTPSKASASSAGIPGLAQALDAIVMRDLLPPALELAGVRSATLGEAAPRLLREKPGRRALVEYVMKNADETRIEVLGKLRAKGIDSRVYAWMHRLTEGGFDTNSVDGISVPRPMGKIDALGMWLQAKVPGVPALECLLGPEYAFAVQRTARCLSKLHCCGANPGRSHRVEEELQILEQRFVRLRAQRPDLRPRLESLLEHCREVAAGLQPAGDATLHRDFYHDQLLFQGDRVFLLDLDLCALGDPGLDVGNFMAHLVEHGLRHPETRDRLEHCAAAFASEYRNLNPAVAHDSIRRWLFLSLCRHVSISHELPERRPWCESLLLRCEQEAGRFQKTTISFQ